MDKPPEYQSAEIIPFLKKYEPKSPEQSPEPPSARIVELPDTPRRQSSDEYSDTSPEKQPQGAEIIEFPSTPTSLRQQASELIGKILAGEEKEHSDDPQHKKIDKEEAAKTIAELLAKAHEKLDDNPRNNCTIELGRLVMALAALDPKAAEALNTPSVHEEPRRSIKLSRHPAFQSFRLMAKYALRYLKENKSESRAENNTDPEPPSIA